MMGVCNVTRLSYQVLLLSVYLNFLISMDPGITCVKLQDRDGYSRLARRSIVSEKEAAKSATEIPSAGHGQDTIIGTARDIEPVAATSHSHDSQGPPKLDPKLGSVNRLSPKSSQSSEKSAFTAWRSARSAKKRAATPEVTGSEGSEARTGKRSKAVVEPEAGISAHSLPSDIGPSSHLQKFQVFAPQSSHISEAAKKNYGTANPFPLAIIVGEEQGSYHQNDALLESSKELLLTNALSRNKNPPLTDPSKMISYEGFVDPISQQKHPIIKPTPKQLTRPILETNPSSSPDKVTRGERSTSASGNRPVGSNLGLGHSGSEEKIVNLDGSRSPSLEGFSEHKSSSLGLEDKSTPSEREISSNHPLQLGLLNVPPEADWNKTHSPQRQGFRSALSAGVMEPQLIASEWELPIAYKFNEKMPVEARPSDEYKRMISSIVLTPGLPSEMRSEEIWAVHEELHRLEKFNYETFYKYFENFFDNLDIRQRQMLYWDYNFNAVVGNLKEYFELRKQIAFDNSQKEKDQLTRLIKSVRILESITSRPVGLGSPATENPILSSASIPNMTTKEAPRADIRQDVIPTNELATHAERTSPLKTHAKGVPFSQSIIRQVNTHPSSKSQQENFVPASSYPNSAPKGHDVQGNLIAGQRPIASHDVSDRIGKEMEKVRIGRDKGVDHLQKAQIARLATAEGYMASIVNFIQKSAPEVQGFMLLRPRITKETREVYHLLRTNPHVNEKGEYKSLPSHPLFAPIMNLSQKAFQKTQKNLFQAMAAEGRISVPSPQLQRGTPAPAPLTASMTSGPQPQHEASSKSMPPGKLVAESHPQMTHESQDSQTPSLIEAERQAYGHHDEKSPGSPKEEDFTEVVNWMGDSHPQIAKDLAALRSGMGSALEQKVPESNLGETPWTSLSQPSPPMHEHTVQRPPSSTTKFQSGQSTIHKSYVPQSQSAYPGLATGDSGSPAPPGVQVIRNTAGQIYPVLVTPNQTVKPSASNIAHGHQEQLHSQANRGNQINQRMKSRPDASMN